MRGMVEGAGRMKDVRGGSPLALPPPLCGNYGDTVAFDFAQAERGLEAKPKSDRHSPFPPLAGEVAGRRPDGGVSPPERLFELCKR